MKSRITLCTAIAAAALLSGGPVRAQDGDRQEAREETQDDLILSERREELISEADRALEDLRRQNELAAALLEEAYGHAVFDTTKGGLILTGVGGTGVARTSDGGDVTFMRLGAAGIGLGAGFENYKLVMLFADEDTYSRFVSGQWDGALSAQAAAGSEGVSSEEQFVGGVRAFRLTEGGLMAQADATALRFWPIDRLNRAAEIEERIAAASGGEVPEAIQEGFAEAAAEAEAEEEAEEEASRGAAANVESAPVPSNPEWLDEIAAEREDLEIFVEAVRAAGLADALTGATEYTVFAPTNEAFESMSGMTREELLAPENRAELVRLLRAHIVADDLDRDMARNIPEALTIDGGTVGIDVEGDELNVGDATVVAPDIKRGNLRVYAVDQVLASPVRVAEAEPRATGEDDESEAAPAGAAGPSDDDAGAADVPSGARSDDAGAGGESEPRETNGETPLDEATEQR